MDINTIKQDGNKASDGVWIDFEDGARVKIRSTDSKIYRNTVHRLTLKKNPVRLRKNPDELLDVTIKAMAEAIILDWDGFSENGQPLPCTPENKLKLCRIEYFRSFISTESQDIANFQSEAMAADAEDLKSGD